MSEQRNESCACRRLVRREPRQNPDGTRSDDGYACELCGRHIPEPNNAPNGAEDDDAAMERTLFHLHLADAAWTRATADAPALGPGRNVSDWPELVLAVADGVHRGWITGASILGAGDEHTMNYGLTRTGRRALRAYRARLRSYPVIDETGEVQP